MSAPGIVLNGKRIDYQQLLAELAIAGITVNGLGSDGMRLFTYDGQGQPIDLPNGAAAVVAAHTASTSMNDTLTAALSDTVGVTLTSLTNTQLTHLVEGLLYKAGALDHLTLKVLPLATWLLD